MTSDLNTMLRIARDAWEGGYATIVATVNAALAKRAGTHRLASGDGVRPVPLSLALRSIRRALHCDEIDAMWQCSFDVNHRKVLIGVRPEHAVPWTVADIGIGSSARPEGDLQAAIQRIEIRAHEKTWRPENVVRATEEVAAWWRRWFAAKLTAAMWPTGRRPPHRPVGTYRQQRADFAKGHRERKSPTPWLRIFTLYRGAHPEDWYNPETNSGGLRNAEGLETAYRHVYSRMSAQTRAVKRKKSK